MGVVAEIVASACCHLKELAAAYLVLAREMARDEGRVAARWVALTAVLLILFTVGTMLLGLGVSLVVRTYVRFEGGGYLITGAVMVVPVVLVLLLLLRKGKK